MQTSEDLKMRRPTSVQLALLLAAWAPFACTPKPSGGGGEINQTDGDECRLEWRAPPAVEGVEKPQIVSPFSLTASDGTGLELISVKARAVVEDPLAFTELHLVFRNPEDRQIEGRFEINLPSGSAISRFAMLIGDRWQEAEVVELQAARRAYEDFLHRRQDPALLEKNAGNSFSARVFPIPARGVKELIVSYSEELPALGDPYRLLLRGLPELQDLDVDVVMPRANGPHHLRLKKQRFMPQEDLELRIDKRPAEVGLRFDRLAVARVAPTVALPQEPMRGLTLLFDTSASRAIDFKGQVARLGRIVEALRAQNGDFDLQVVCFDQTVEQVFLGRASSFSGDAQQAILRRAALGASDLEGALRWLNGRGGAQDRVLVVSDGIVTAGASEPDAVRAAAAALGASGVSRIDAIVDGGIQDMILLRHLTTAGLGKAGIVANARQSPDVLASRILRATLADVKVSVPGAGWVWPETLESVQPGDTFLIFADLPADAPMRVALGEKGDDVREVALKTSARPLLERAWVKASIGRLTAMMGKEAAGNDAAKDALVAQIIELSTRFRVLSDYTALLVLETEFDYQRFGIDRRGLAEILTVGADGLTVIDRTQLPGKNGMPAIAAAEPVAPPQPTRRKGMFGDLFGGDGDRAEAEEEMPAWQAAATPMAEAPPESDDEAGGQGQRHRGEEGRMGRPSDARPEPMEAREEAKMKKADSPSRSRSSNEGRAASGGAPAGASAPMPTSAPRVAPPSDPGAWADAAVDGIGAAERSRPAPRPVMRPPPVAPDRWQSPPPPPPPPAVATWERPRVADPYDGRFAAVMVSITAGQTAKAIEDAWAWRNESPGDELAILALGEAAEASGDLALAARAYGSLIDLFPGRADIRRMAGQRLESLGEAGLGLAVDTFRLAVEQRADHPSSHRLYAFALLRAGRPAEAFAAALVGARTSYPSGRFAGVQRILGEDLRLIAAAWLAQKPGEAEAIRAQLDAAGVVPDTTPSLRFVLNWETDANDVDFHIYDGKGGHAYFSSRGLASGGELYADVTTGYGPECFTVPGVASAYPYDLQGHYYSRGPMGYGMGKLEIIEHDGKGGLVFAENPFAIMKDSAYVDLGRLEAPLSSLKMSTPRLNAPWRAGKGTSAGASGGSYTPPPPPTVPLGAPPSRF
jgi:hypothetical protein